MKNRIKFKMNRSQMTALMQMTQNYLFQLLSDSIAHILVKEMMIEVVEQLESKLNNREQNKFSLNMSDAQAYAFWVFWQKVDLSEAPFEGVLIDRILSEIHQKHVNAHV